MKKMPSSNKPLTPPPIETSVINSLGNPSINTPWLMWLNKLHSFIPNSNRNNQAIIMASPVNLDASYVTLTTTSASYAITLDAPTIPSLFKTIELISYTAGKDVTMSLSNVTGGTASTTCTWNGVNQSITLRSRTSDWEVIKQNGVTLS